MQLLFSICQTRRPELTRRTIRLLLTCSSFLCLLVSVSNLSGQDDDSSEVGAKDARIVATLLRMENFDLNSRPKIQESVIRYLDSVEDPEKYLMVVEKLRPNEQGEKLISIASENPDSDLGVRATRLLFQMKLRGLLSERMDSDDESIALPIIQVVGRVGNRISVFLLRELITDSDRSMSIRSAAVRSIGKSNRGRESLLADLEAENLPDQLKFTAGDVLYSAGNAEIRAKLESILPRPESGDSEPLPPIEFLTKLAGDADQGAAVFEKEGTCIKCHQVGSAGKEVGPNLSEIGSKLSRVAMYESILEPSAGISHNYESYVVTTLDGEVITGILLSETSQEIVLKDVEAITHSVLRDDVDEFVKQTVSIMPAGLQKSMTQQQLVDLVEYLMTLKKPDLP